jgi:uncharacterized iron-regulated protein
MLNACEDSTVGSTDIGIEAAPVLKDVAEGVILATYVDLDAKAGLLVQAADSLKTSTTDANLDAARQAWRAARRPWEQSEAFLFGPVDTKGIDPGIDSWPVNRVDLDGVLAGSASLTKEYIDGLEGTLKGFHTIEYLLFGSGNGKKAAEMTARELEYLTALVRSFKGSTAQLRTEWEPTGGNFVAELVNAGGEGSSYLSRKDGIQELLTGMVDIADEVANGKINEPFTRKDRTREESQFSDNSNADFQDNIRSIRNLYLGTYGSFSGKGISTLVAARNSTLDARLLQEIDAAISALGEMTPSFGEAITSNKAKVEAAQTAVRRVKQTLESEVKPLVLGN